MFWKKQKSKFIQVKEEIDSHLMDRRLSAAMALFNDFHNIYSSYSEKDKAFYRTEYFQTKSKLTLLMKIEELLQVVKIDNLEKLKDKLNEIEELTNKDIEEMPQRLYNHIAHHFNQSRKIYLYKSKKQELDKIIKNVRNLLTEQNYDVALRLFPEIIKNTLPTVTCRRW